MAADLEGGYEDWQQVGAAYYARRELYPIDWEARGVNLAFMRVFPAPAGGPLAMLRDDRKLVLYLGAATKPDIQLFTAAGSPLGRVLWDKGRVLAAGWGLEEQLLVVDDRGQVFVFSARGGQHTQQASLGMECEQEGVADAVVFPTGVVALSPLRHLWCIPSLEESRAVRFPAPCAPDSAVHCMAVIPPRVSASGSLEVVVAVDNTLKLIDANEALPTAVFEGPILRLAASPDGKYVAGYGQDGTVHVWTADIADVVTRVGVSETAASFAETFGVAGAGDAGSSGGGSEGDGGRDVGGPPQTPPDQLVWCGSGALALFWEGTGLLLITLAAEWRWWECDASAALVAEVDGCRILTQQGHFLLRRVPDVLTSVLEIGSTSPGALLYDARRLFDAQDARATGELLEILKAGDLPAAVTTCLRAAAAELDPHKQAALMKASCYGRAFCVLDPTAAGHAAPTLPQDRASRMETVEVARQLRVINALRDPEIGIPLTLPQLQREGLPRIVSRLVGRRHYLLAMRIAEALGVPTEQVLARWACDKISAAAGSLPDDALLEALQAKLRGQPGVKYAQVAAHAQEVGRRQLAALLLEHEKCAGDQVPLLLELGEDDRALDRAVESGDSDLVFQVVHAWWRRLERSSTQAGASTSYDQPIRPTPAAHRFWAAVARRPAALAFFAKYHRHSNPALLIELYEGLGRHDQAAELHLSLALDMIAGGGYTETQVQRRLVEAKDAYNKAGAADKKQDHKWEAGGVTQLAKLRELQAELQDSTRREGFVGLSVVDTLRQCFKLGLKEQAAKLAKDFKVPEKQFLLIQAWTLAQQHDWPALQHLAGRLDRRAPVSVENFVAACRSHGAPPEVTRWFIDRITGDNHLVRKAQLYNDIGLHREARLLAEQAEQQGTSGVAASMLGSLRGAVGGGGGVLGSLMGRVGSASGNSGGGGGGSR